MVRKSMGRGQVIAFCLSLCLLLSFSTLAAEKELSIAEAVALAQAADIDYRIAALTWENAQIDDRTARASGPLTPYETLQRDLQFRRAENTFAQAHTSLVLGVIRDYISLRQSKAQLEIRERQLKLAEAELERVEQLIAIGNATEQDRLREINRVTSARLSAAAARRTFESRYESFLSRLGLDPDVKLILQDELPVVPFNYTLEETLETARAASFDVWEREVNMKLAEMDLNNLMAQNPAPLALKKAENNFTIQQLNAQKAETAFITQTTEQFHRMADAWTELQNAERDYLVAMESYKQAVRQYEAGLRTETDMASAEIDRLNAELAIFDARNNYALSLLEFEVMLGLPLPYGEEAEQ